MNDEKCRFHICGRHCKILMGMDCDGTDENCSFYKAELIEVILRASELASPTFPWKQIVAIIKTKMIKRKTDEKLDELEVLLKKLQSVPEEKRVIENDEVRNLMTAINNNLTECNELYNQQNKIEKELYE